VVYRSPAFRPPDLGLAGVRRYLNEQLPAEKNIECWFGQPIVSGHRAAVEWWASWTEQRQELTYAGLTVLHFDDQGQVVEHRDYEIVRDEADSATRGSLPPILCPGQQDEREPHRRGSAESVGSSACDPCATRGSK
jgi:hypothetical protein